MEEKSCNAISSKAVMKYEKPVPLVYIQLDKHTDLKVAPDNWMNDSLAGKFANVRERKPFDNTSLLMADKYPDIIGEADVISAAVDIKKLLKIPFSSSPISMSVHRVGKSLLLNDFDIPTLLHSQIGTKRYDQLIWLRDLYLSATQNDDFYPKKRNKEQCELEMILSKFMYHSIQDRCAAIKEPNSIQQPPQIVQSVYLESKPRLSLDDASISPPTGLTQQLMNPVSSTDPLFNDQYPDSFSSSFQRDILWNFEDITMLVGSDLPIFGGGKYPAVSLRLRESSKPINVLTGIDYWLDNLMCNVPEIIMCYHLKGIVQQYEQIKTSDIPNLEGSSFSPKVVCDIAQNILSFLKTNCTKEGHTYWLYKSSKDDVVKLYDLTSIAIASNGQKDPFRISVAHLLYRIAHNMYSCGDIDEIIVTKVVEMLESCVRLIENEKDQINLLIMATHLLSKLYSTRFHKNNETLFDFELDINDDGEESEYEKSPSSPVSSMPIKTMCIPSKITIKEEKPSVILTIETKCKKAIAHCSKMLTLFSNKFNSELDVKKYSINDAPLLQQKNITSLRPFKNDIKEFMSDDIDELTIKESVENIALESYAKLIDIYISKGKLGHALRYVQLAFYCISDLKHKELVTNNLTNVLIFFGDILTLLSKNYVNVEAETEDFHYLNEHDLAISNSLKSVCIAHLGEVEIKDIHKCFKNSHEELLQQSLKIYEEALSKTNENEMENKFSQVIELTRRLGNVRNELGVMYMNQAANNTKLFGPPTDIEVKLWKKSFSFFQYSVESFEVVQDRENLALIYSNMGKLMHLCAQVYGNSSKTSLQDTREQFTQQEKTYFGKAFEYYNKAMSTLKNNDKSTIWKSVSLELSGCYFSMAELMQDYTPLRWNAEESACLWGPETCQRYQCFGIQVIKDVSSTLMKALQYSEPLLHLDGGFPNNKPVKTQVASIHQRLASLYHHVLRNQISDNGKKSYRSLAELHYKKVYQILLPSEFPFQILQAFIEHMALYDFLLQQHQSVKFVKLKLEVLSNGINNNMLKKCIECLISNKLKNNSENEAKKEEELHKILMVLNSQLSSTFKEAIVIAKKAKNTDHGDISLLKQCFEVIIRTALNGTKIFDMLNYLHVILSKIYDVYKAEQSKSSD